MILEVAFRFKFFCFNSKLEVPPIEQTHPKSYRENKMTERVMISVRIKWYPLNT